MRSGGARGAPTLVGALLALAVVSVAGGRPAAVPPVDTGNPVELVDSVARTLLTDIDAHRDQYRTDSDKLDNLVRRALLPHFDSKLAARLVLARQLDDASIEQRRRFIDLAPACRSQPRRRTGGFQPRSPAGAALSG